MVVQDDVREAEMLRLAGLRAGGDRSGVDAYHDFEDNGRSYSAPMELKSTTSRAVSTARDVGPGHIGKWRSRIWMFGFYDSASAVLRSLLVLGPDDMEPWIGRIERYIASDFQIGERIVHGLTLEDVHVICGEKEVYGLDDAKALHKRQWSEDRYASEMDVADGYSPVRMLEILKLRARYLNARGATLNNPHVPKRFLSRFVDREANVRDGDVDRLRPFIQESIRAKTLAIPALRRLAAAAARERP